MDSSRGRNVNLDVGLHTTETNADARLLEEVLDEVDSGVTLDLSLGKVETELDGSAVGGSGGGDTVEEGAVFPGVGERASSGALGLGDLVVGTETKLDIGIDTGSTTNISVNTGLDTIANLSADASLDAIAYLGVNIGVDTITDLGTNISLDTITNLGTDISVNTVSYTSVNVGINTSSTTDRRSHRDRHRHQP